MNELAEQVERLRHENETLKSYEIVGLKRELDLERGENNMLKEKLAAWRLELKRDMEITKSHIGTEP